MKFCTYQDSTAVLVCAKFNCDQIRIVYITAVTNLIKFEIQSNYVAVVRYLVWQKSYMGCTDH